jgi:hypothetical protein
MKRRKRKPPQQRAARRDGASRRKTEARLHQWALQIIGGALAALIAAGVIAAVTLSGRDSPVARVELWRPSILAQSGAAWRVTALAVNTGERNLSGCGFICQDVDASGFPLRYYPLRPKPPWGLKAGARRRESAVVGWQPSWFPGNPTNVYVEAWVECVTPPIVSSRHFYLLDFSKRIAYAVSPNLPWTPETPKLFRGVPSLERCAPLPFRKRPCRMHKFDLTDATLVPIRRL